MSATLKDAKDGVTIARLLLIQLVAFVVISVALYFKHPFWPIPALCGGLVGWLPNVIFMLLTRYSLTAVPVSKTTSGLFMIAWVLKMLVTVVLLVIAIQVFKAEIIPLGLGFLSVIAMQFLAPVMAAVFK